jgi:hypothetical protein
MCTKTLAQIHRGIYKENGMKGVHIKSGASEASNGLNVTHLKL